MEKGGGFFFSPLLLLLALVLQLSQQTRAESLATEAN